jgi:hypothetical protein
MPHPERRLPRAQFGQSFLGGRLVGGGSGGRRHQQSQDTDSRLNRQESLNLPCAGSVLRATLPEGLIVQEYSSRESIAWRWAIFLIVVAGGQLFIVAGLLRQEPREIGIVMLFSSLGTLWAHATLAAGWTAFGPLRSIPARITIAAVWLTFLYTAFAHGVVVSETLPPETIVPIAGCLFSQWIAVQILFWILAAGMGWQLRSSNTNPGSNVQFQLKHLLIVMAFAGTVLGIGRILVTPSFANEYVRILSFITVGSIFNTIALMLAVLLPHRAMMAVAIVFAAVVAAAEVPLLEVFELTEWDSWTQFISLNVGQSAWILLVSGILRWGGYRIGSRNAAQV